MRSASVAAEETAFGLNTVTQPCSQKCWNAVLNILKVEAEKAVSDSEFDARNTSERSKDRVMFTMNWGAQLLLFWRGKVFLFWLDVEWINIDDEGMISLI